MTNELRVAMVLGFLGSSPALGQDLYRCDYINQTVYQGTPCAIGVQQRAIDPANARREQVRDAMEQERLKKKKEAEQRSNEERASAS
jgi:hypothetical protein